MGSIGGCDDVIDFKKIAINKTSMELNSWLKSKGYEYMIIDSRCLINYGIDETNVKVQELISSGLFEPVHQAQGVIIFKVK